MNMLMKLLAVILAAAMSVSVPALADDDEGDEKGFATDGEATVACKTLAAFTIAAGVYTLSARLGLSVFAGLQAADVTPASSSAMGTCVDWFTQYVRSQRERRQSYDDFLREFCDGNPYNCPNNLAVRQLVSFGDPRHCDTWVICAMDLLGAFKPNGASTSDLINAMQFVEHSVFHGYWVGDDYGYLLGLPPRLEIDGPIGFDIY